MCKKCTRFFRKLPESELCPDHPSYINNLHPLRCCEECAQRVKEHVRIDHQHEHKPKHRTTVGMRIIDSDEYLPSYHSKVYMMPIPPDRTVVPGQTVRAVLGGRINHVVIPYDVRAGDVLYVRANDVFIHYPKKDSADHTIVVDASGLVDKVIDRLHDEGAISRSATEIEEGYQSESDSTESEEEGKEEESELYHGEGEYVHCENCRTLNPIRSNTCEVCGIFL